MKVANIEFEISVNGAVLFLVSHHPESSVDDLVSATFRTCSILRARGDGYPNPRAEDLTFRHRTLGKAVIFEGLPAGFNSKKVRGFPAFRQESA